MEMRQTKPYVWEAMGESKWCSPYHLTHMEVETKDGVKLRAVPDIRKSSKIISFRDKMIEMPSFLK